MNYISDNKELCDTYMGKYPVIFLSLKGVEGLTFEEAKYRLIELIGTEAERFAFLDDSDRLSANEKEKYRALIALNNGRASHIQHSIAVKTFIPALWTENSNTH